jgi:IMP dehydrogenase
MAARVVSEGLTFADVLIKPNYSEIPTRDDIDTESFYLGASRQPLISAPMDYVTGYAMARKLAELNAYGVVNRFSEESQGRADFDYALAIGIRNIDKTFIRLEKERPSCVCIDVAHGHHLHVLELLDLLKKEFPQTLIMAGNVATYEGVKFLAEAGVDAIRVGIGPGSACSTRENTGVGIPQLTAIMEASRYRELESKRDFSIIADGGIQTPGDIVKALAAGADAVMLGRMFAGHEETPGTVVKISGDYYKEYRGQSMLGSNGKRGVPEGVSGLVPYVGPVYPTVQKLLKYLQSGMSYVGAFNIPELREKAEFIKISPGTFKESETRI